MRSLKKTLRQRKEEKERTKIFKEKLSRVYDINQIISFYEGFGHEDYKKIIIKERLSELLKNICNKEELILYSRRCSSESGLMILIEGRKAEILEEINRFWTNE
jgi:hypothetical protein